MKALLGTVLGALLCASGVLVAAELLRASGGESMRDCVYAGGAAGGLLALAALPFALVLARIQAHKGDDAQFWKWWGCGLLLRMALLAGLTCALNRWCAPHPTAAAMTMMAVYLFGLFTEVAWLASVLAQADPKRIEKKV